MYKFNTHYLKVAPVIDTKFTWTLYTHNTCMCTCTHTCFFFFFLFVWFKAVGVSDFENRSWKVILRWQYWIISAVWPSRHRLLVPGTAGWEPCATWLSPPSVESLYPAGLLGLCSAASSLMLVLAEVCLPFLPQIPTFPLPFVSPDLQQ